MPDSSGKKSHEIIAHYSSYDPGEYALSLDGVLDSIFTGARI